MRERFQWPLSSRATLGGFASGSLVANTAWWRLPGRASSSLLEVPYLADVVVGVGSIVTNTLGDPAVGVTLTLLLVLAVMYQAVARLEVRETADLYTTRRFRMVLVVVAGGFGLGITGFFGGFEEGGLLSGWSIESLLGAWFLFSWLGTSGLLAHWSDPTGRDNPVVALLARTSGDEPAVYRREQITDTWAPGWLAAAVATLAAGIVVTLLGVLLGGVVAIATLLYPLPEVSVLLWVAAQLAGIHRLPYLGWIERAEVEGRVYERLGAGTVTAYGLFVALAYLVALAISTLLFAIVGVPVFLSGADSLGGLLASTNPQRLLTSPDLATTATLLLALMLGPILAALYYVAYWILAILRLPAVPAEALPDYTGDATASYPRLEGRTLSAGALMIWTAVFVRMDPFDEPSLQVLFLLAFLGSSVPTAWTLYRAIAGTVNPQPVDDEEWVLVSAAGIQGVTFTTVFLLVGAGSPTGSVLLAVLFVGLVAGAQYFGRRLHVESADEPDSPYSSGLLVAACLVLVPVFHWFVPELSPVVPIVLVLGACAMAATHLMDRWHQ